MTAPLVSYTKDSTSKLDYGLNWSSWMNSTASETLSDSSWTIPSGITSTNSTFDSTGLTTVWLDGGSDGSDYMVRNKIETSGGRIDTRTIAIRVRNR